MAWINGTQLEFLFLSTFRENNNKQERVKQVVIFSPKGYGWWQGRIKGKEERSQWESDLFLFPYILGDFRFKGKLRWVCLDKGIPLQCTLILLFFFVWLFQVFTFIKLIDYFCFYLLVEPTWFTICSWDFLPSITCDRYQW